MRWKIYKLTNNVNGKIYIGITKKSINQRFSCHVWDSAFSKKRKTVIAKAIRKYGKKSFFVKEIDESFSEQEALEKEAFYINLLGSHVSCGGYNILEKSLPQSQDVGIKAKIIESRRLSKRSLEGESQFSSKYVGVLFDKESQKWQYAFSISRKRYGQKGFETEKEAAVARDILLSSLLSRDFCLQMMNFPEDYSEYLTGAISNTKIKKARSEKKSSFFFVLFFKDRDRWGVRVRKNGKVLSNIGLFYTENEAAERADFENLKTIKNVELLNFPENLEKYSSQNYIPPQTIFESSKTIPYKNISLDSKGFYITQLKVKGKRLWFRSKNLEEAILKRDEFLKEKEAARSQRLFDR